MKLTKENFSNTLSKNIDLIFENDKAFMQGLKQVTMDLPKAQRQEVLASLKDPENYKAFVQYSVMNIAGELTFREFGK